MKISKFRKVFAVAVIFVTMFLTFAAFAHHGHHPPHRHHSHHGYVAPIAFGLGMVAGRTFAPPPPPVVVVPPQYPVRVWVSGYWLPNGVYIPGHWEYR